MKVGTFNLELYPWELC